MPLFVVERTFAEDLDVSSDDIREVDAINADEGVRWIFSFLSADKRQTYCLYEAPSSDAIIAPLAPAKRPPSCLCGAPSPDVITAAARKPNLPADAVIGVGSASEELAGALQDWAAPRT